MMQCECENPRPGCCPANAKEASDSDVRELAAKAADKQTEKMAEKLEESG